MTIPDEPRAPTSALERGFDRLLAGLARFATLVSGCCLVVLIAIFGWLVFGRYVLNATPTWAEQLGLLLVVVITFFSAAVGIYEQRHLSVDFLRDALPRAPRRALLFVGDVAIAAFGLLMALHAWDLVLFKWSTSIPLIDLPEGLRSLPLTVCGVLLLLFAGSRALRRLAGRYPWDDEHLFDPLDALRSGEPAPLEAPRFEATPPSDSPSRDRRS